MRFTFTERAKPFAEVGYGDNRIASASEGVWDVDLWDHPDSEWAGTEPNWRDISCDVWDFSCEYGRTALSDRFVPGTATFIVRNVSGWADPDRFGIRPGRAIRVGIDHEEFGRIILFRGFVDAVVPTYAPGMMDQAEFSCVDALGEINRTKVKPFDPVQGDGQRAHERVIDILDRAKWSPVKRDIWETTWTLIADAQGGQVADLLGRIGDSVGGSVWGDTEGRIAWRPRDWQLWAANLPLDAVIGNVDPTDVCPGAWQRPFDRASISTMVMLGRDPETAYVVEDQSGMVLYGIEPFVRTDLLTKEDSMLYNLAERTLATRSHATAPRVRSVNFDARNGAEQLDLMTTVDVYRPSHYRCRLEEPRGLIFDDRYIATAVSHHLTADVWTLELNLDLAAPYAVAMMAGRWDSAEWDLNAWVDTSVPLDVLDRARRLIQEAR